MQHQPFDDQNTDQLHPKQMATSPFLTKQERSDIKKIMNSQKVYDKYKQKFIIKTTKSKIQSRKQSQILVSSLNINKSTSLEKSSDDRDEQEIMIHESNTDQRFTTQVNFNPNSVIDLKLMDEDSDQERIQSPAPAATRQKNIVESPMGTGQRPRSSPYRGASMRMRSGSKNNLKSREYNLKANSSKKVTLISQELPKFIHQAKPYLKNEVAEDSQTQAITLDPFEQEIIAESPPKNSIETTESPQSKRQAVLSQRQAQRLAKPSPPMSKIYSSRIRMRQNMAQLTMERNQRELMLLRNESSESASWEKKGPNAN